eukprot:5816243-Amphidinium_carterae.1
MAASRVKTSWSLIDRDSDHRILQSAEVFKPDGMRRERQGNGLVVVEAIAMGGYRSMVDDSNCIPMEVW